MPAIITLLNPSHKRRGTKRRRRGNPGHLVILNGKRRTTMAAKRRRRRTTRRVASNPRRRRRTTSAAPRRRRRRTAVARTNRRRRGLFNPRRRRRSNPRRRRVTHRRRSNPQLKGIVEGSLAAAAGAIITDFVQGMVPFSFGGATGKIAVRLGLAYAIGMAAEKFAPTRKYATWLAVGGAVGAAQDLFRLFMGGGLTAAPVAAGQLPAGRVALPAYATGDDQGMSDIVGVPQNWGGLGEIVGVSYPQGYFQ